MISPALLALVIATAPLTEAEQQFRKGRDLLKSGQVSQACTAFEKSHALEPALGALLNWGICLEQDQQQPAAYLKLAEAQAWAVRVKEPSRETLAAQHLRGLAGTLGFVSVRGVPAGAVVRVRSLELPGGVPSVLVPVTREGPVILQVTAPQFVAWSLELPPPAAGQTVEVLVPALQKVSELKAPPPMVSADAPATKPQVVLAPSVASSAPTTAFIVRRNVDTRVAPAAVAGVVTGGALVVAGAAGVAWSTITYGKLQAQQPGQPQEGNPTVTRKDFDTMQWLYPASWGAVGVGAALGIASGIILAKGVPVSVSVGPQGGAVTVQGQF